MALALQAETGDREARVADEELTLYLVVADRWIVAPPRVRRFVHAFDGLPVRRDQRAALPRVLPDELAPFEFILPPTDGPDWLESCSACQRIVAPDDLDAEGCCEDCREGGDS